MLTRKENILYKRIEFVQSLDCPDSHKKHLIGVREQCHHSDWEKSVQKHLPELAKRVFDLRNYYFDKYINNTDLEKLLGTVIRDINNVEGLYRHTDENELMAEKVVRKIFVNELFSRIKKAEKCRTEKKELSPD